MSRPTDHDSADSRARDLNYDGVRDRAAVQKINDFVTNTNVKGLDKVAETMHDPKGLPPGVTPDKPSGG